MKSGKYYFSYFCDNCKLTMFLRSRFARDKHVKQCSPANVIPSIIKKETLNHHKLKVHSSKEDLRVSCDECDKTYSNRDGLKRHKSSEHLGLRDYKCLECPAQFARKDTLDDHMRRGKHYFMYFCEQCKLTMLLRSKVARDKHVKQCSPALMKME